MPLKEEDSKALHIISDILDKLIETQKSNAEGNIVLKNIVADVVREISQMRALFSNGFKSELKAYLSEETQKQTDVLMQYMDSQPHDQILKRITDIENAIIQIGKTVTNSGVNITSIQTDQKSLWHWVTHVGMVIVGVGMVIAAVVKIMQWMGV